MDFKVGKYSFNSRFCLGEGAYGKVFMGVNTLTNEQVAIKQIDTKFIEQQDKYIKQQIINEIDILKRCDHPNIVRFIDLLEQQKFIYIVIEYCRDGDLKEMLHTKRISEAEGFNILSQIVEGFKELQRNGIIHRDLKPANILIDNGVYKIADFGFAKIVNNYSSSHMLKSLVGSPYYMAPQLLGYQQYNYKCDIWSLAVIYYEIIMGDLPWLASDPSSLLKKIISQPILTKLKEAKVSSFSMYFLEKTLTIDEFRRPTWEEVYMMVQSSPLQSASQIQSVPQLKKKNSIFDQDASQISQTRSQVSQKDSFALSPELKTLRQELIFKHYLCQEIFINRDEILRFCDDSNVLLKLVYVLSKCVVYQSAQLIKLCKEPGISRLVSKENDFYIQFHADVESVNIEFTLDKANQLCLQFSLQYLLIAQSKMSQMTDTYLLVITELLINFVRILRDAGDTPIDFEELAQSKINDNDFQLYHQILSTNLSAITI